MRGKGNRTDRSIGFARCMSCHVARGVCVRDGGSETGKRGVICCWLDYDLEVGSKVRNLIL